MQVISYIKLENLRFMKIPQNTPPFMAGMNAVRGYGGSNPPSTLFKKPRLLRRGVSLLCEFINNIGPFPIPVQTLNIALSSCDEFHSFQHSIIPVFYYSIILSYSGSCKRYEGNKLGYP
jgi:hypothetical protein